MAKLTDYLDNGVQGKPVRDPGYVPGGTATALGALSSGLDAFMDRKRSMDAARKEKEKERLAMGERAAEMDSVLALTRAQEAAADSKPLVTPVLDVASLSDEERADRAAEGAPLSAEVFNEPTSEFPTEVVRDATTAGGRLQSVQAAVDQSTMPQISLNAAMQREFQALLVKYPEHTKAIIETWKSLGVDSALFREIRMEQAEFDAQVDRETELKDTIYDLGAKSLGAGMASMTTEEVMAVGLREYKAQSDLKILQDQATLLRTQTDISATQRKEAETNLNKSYEQFAIISAHNAFAPVTSAFQKGMIAISKLPTGQQEAAFQQLAPMLEQEIDSFVNQQIANLVANGYSGDVTSLRTKLEAQAGVAKEMFTGEITVAKSNLEALRAIETRMKIDTAQALSVLTALKSVGLSTPEIQAMTAQIAANPELLQNLQDEIKGFTGEFGRENASTRIMNIVNMMKGRGPAFEDMSLEEQKRTLEVVGPATRDLVQQFVRGENVDGDMVLNGLGSIITATRTLGPSSSLNSFRVATTTFAMPEMRKALRMMAKNPNDPNQDMAQATAMGSRAASALILEDVQLKLKNNEGGNSYWSAKWDNRNGRWVGVFDKKKYDIALKSVDRSRGRNIGEDKNLLPTRLTPSRDMPKDLQRLIGVANINLDNIMDLKDLDPNTPKGSDLELRAYYGNNVLPKSLRESRENPLDPEGAIDDILGSIKQSFDDLPATNQQVSLPPAERWRRDAAGNPNLSLVEEAAVEFGVPPDVAVALVGFESSFNPKAVGDPVPSRNGDTAYGLGQLMSREASAAAKALGLPADRKSWTPAQQARAAMWLLKQKHEEAGTGDWKDAVSRYFSGANYAGNKRSDGNIDVPGYIRNIFGG